MHEQCFTLFSTKIEAVLLPKQLNNPFEGKTPEICSIAAQELQDYISIHQQSWSCNFGLDSSKEGIGRGKMFGVLVVKNKMGQLGYLSAFSGKLSDEAPPAMFVPSLFDISTDDFFLVRGMDVLKTFGRQIKAATSATEIEQLKTKRKATSIQLQQKIFDNYHFLNEKGETKSLCAIFKETINKTPAAGAGECAAPKLFQYAFTHKMKPIAITEFWWGISPDSQKRQHKMFYPACRDKCVPILTYMLGQGIKHKKDH